MPAEENADQNDSQPPEAIPEEAKGSLQVKCGGEAENKDCHLEQSAVDDQLDVPSDPLACDGPDSEVSITRLLFESKPAAVYCTNHRPISWR